MSYTQAMKHDRNHRKDRHRQPIIMATPEHEMPWLGGYWYEPGRETERRTFIDKWRAERGLPPLKGEKTND